MEGVGVCDAGRLFAVTAEGRDEKGYGRGETRRLIMKLKSLGRATMGFAGKSEPLPVACAGRAPLREIDRKRWSKQTLSRSGMENVSEPRRMP